jgi:hypothetical protein
MNMKEQTATKDDRGRTLANQRVVAALTSADLFSNEVDACTSVRCSYTVLPTSMGQPREIKVNINSTKRHRWRKVRNEVLRYFSKSARSTRRHPPTEVDEWNQGDEGTPKTKELERNRQMTRQNAVEGRKHKTRLTREEKTKLKHEGTPKTKDSRRANGRRRRKTVEERNR